MKEASLHKSVDVNNVIFSLKKLQFHILRKSCNAWTDNARSVTAEFLMKWHWTCFPPSILVSYSQCLIPMLYPHSVIFHRRSFVLEIFCD